ncbi:restriction endonuclease subunit S [Cronobacter sakazakii]|uniref:restriction endonuclease subunit S n=1 Tax=Cronobacter sakazakii TaxID=28141 RepID=UPI000A0FFCD0|nr:restriction endonuclease subunit S [Cronobacter sakazakii]EDZ1273687.1 restriction endonuclease subunit S [Salmonella enterica]ELY6384761.1 restriction endonuclease subunit S [Cronobacter sakazakii]PQY35722.1 restriction endonuclease subunit S [Cronobacter sakazakii]
MSEMSYLEKLLDGVEVEWKTLGSIAELKRGTSITKKDVIDGTIPVVAGGRTPAYYHNTSNRDGQTIVIAGSGAYAGFVSWWEEPIFVSDAFTVKPHNILLPRYCYHFLMNMQQQLHEFKSGGGVPHVYPRDVSPILIPIPCPDNPEKSLAIQSEIVRILDKFTALTAELTAELTLRKKQYNYYRDKLLSFEECEVEWKTLDEVASFRRGSFPQPYGNSEWYNGEGCMPFVQVADVADFGFRLHRSTKQQISKLAQSKSVFVEAGTVIVSLQGTIGRVALTQYDCYVDRTLAIFTKYKAAVNKKYFAHQLKAKFDLEKEFARGSTLKTITKEEFSKFQIPIPPLEVQNRIVALLDKFDRLTHSIEEGLPRELELRQKQYEYYRELLFSFPKPEAASN